MLRKTPLKRRTPLSPASSPASLKRSTKPIAKRSEKQKEREAELLRVKMARIDRMLKENGVARCEKEGCLNGWSDRAMAKSLLHAHHLTQRSLGGREQEENLALWSFRCHIAKHAGGRVFWGDEEKHA